LKAESWERSNLKALRPQKGSPKILLDPIPMTRHGDSVEILLSQSEALVLFEWLAKRGDQDDELSADQAEQQVLWKMEGQLESTLDVIFAPDYLERVSAAKKAILGE